jgi:hypothetical protein
MLWCCFQREGAVLTYGSCKLEADDAEADMDLICVAPKVKFLAWWVFLFESVQWLSGN